MNRKIPFASFEKMHSEIEKEMLDKFKEVYQKNWFIQGEEVSQFEKEFAQFCNAEYCVGVGNGLDALYLSLKALGIGKGDEVIVPSNTYIATALAVTYAGAIPVFVEPDLRTFNIDGTNLETVLSNKTKAIIPVHLYGQAAEMDSILAFAKKHQIYVIEDCAQAHGATYKGKRVGTLGDIGCFSFYPGKNLGALGDGGAIVTNRKDIADKVRMLGNYGSDKKYEHKLLGNNSRLDEIQAAFLRIKLKQLVKYNTFRENVAERYMSEIKNPKIVLPVVAKDRTHVWHIFAVLCDERDNLQEYLKQNGVFTMCHYPIPIYRQEAYSFIFEGQYPIADQISSKELSLPMYYGMEDDEIKYVVKLMNEF